MSVYMRATEAVEKFLGRPCNAATVWRWCHYGLRGRKLRTIKVGNHFECTVEDVRDFFERHESEDAAPADSMTGRKRQQASVERQLQAELA